MTESEGFRLSLEHEFDICSFSNSVKNLNREEAQHCLVELYRQMLIRDAFYKQLLSDSWQSKLSELPCE